MTKVAILSNSNCWLFAPDFHLNSLASSVGRTILNSVLLRSQLLPRQSANNLLDNKPPPMASTSQAPNLKGIHHEMHHCAELIRIMIELNARLM